MKNNLTELVFILDKSGSMAGMESDTIGGFNAMIEKQKKAEGRALISTILFSNDSQVFFDRVSLEEITPLTSKDYHVGGMTALLDAIGGAIKHISDIHKYARKEDVPSRTLFIITTDGMENASKNYYSTEIKELISRKQEENGWEFIFLASNIDAVETAKSMGIRKECAVNYVVEEETKEMYEELGDTICKFRSCNSAPLNCSEEITNGIKQRKK